MNEVAIKTDTFLVKTQSPSIRTFDLSNETNIDIRDVEPEQRRKFRRLIRHHTDSDKRRVDTRISADVDFHLNKGTIEGVCFQLDLTSAQTVRAKTWFDSLDRQRLGYPTEVVAFAVCIHAVKGEEDDTGEPVRQYHPFRKDENNDPEFVRVAKSVKQVHRIDQNQIVSVLNKLGNQLPV